MAANLSFLKKLIKEDFDKKDQNLVGRIALILNPALESITNLMGHGLLISDLNTQVKDLTFEVDSNGIPTHPTSFASTLNGKCSMIIAGRAQNLADSTIYPTGGQSISFSQNNGQITIIHITGLIAGPKWQVRVIAYV
jgi:hypothetical protein